MVELGFQNVPSGADFAEQAAAGIEVTGGRSENLPHQIEAVRAAEMGHLRLTGIFLGEGLDLGRRHIGGLVMMRS